MRRLPLAALLLLLGGCTPLASPPVPEAGIPKGFAYSIGEAGAPQVASASWWRHFNDEQLNQVVEQALASNLGLAQVKLRIERTRILLGHSEDEFLPELHARTQFVNSPDVKDSYFQYGFDASWELDLFGRGDATRNLARASLQLAETGESAARTALVAEVVRHYLALRAHQQQASLLNQQGSLLQQEQELIAVRQRLQLPMLQQQSQLQQQVLELEGKRLEQQHQSEMAAQQLAQLLGKTTVEAQWLQARPLPVLAPFRFDALPAELLRSRADIRVAEAEVLRAASELGIARAELYPHLALGTSYYLANNVTNDIDLSNPTHSTLGIAPLIDIPLFDWGRRRAAVHANELQLQEALLAYRQAVQEAVAETETALLSMQWQAKWQQQSQEQGIFLQAQTEKQALRVAHGFSSKLDQLALDRKRIEQQQAAVEVQMQYNLAFVALYKALGGAALPQAGE